MKTFDDIYASLGREILNRGIMQVGQVRTKYADGEPALTKTVLGKSFTITPDMGVPILRSKFVGTKTPLIELDWIWRTMSNDVNWLKERNVHIWDEWGMEPKDSNRHTIGKAYGYQMKHQVRVVDGVEMNQTEYVLDQVKYNPNSRRIVTSLLDISDAKDMALEPCVWSTTWMVLDGKLNLSVKQRSSDFCLGLPYNVYQYWTLLHLVAMETGWEVGDMFWTIDNLHIYDRHEETLKEQLDYYDSLPMREKDAKFLYLFDNLKDYDFWTYDFNNIRILEKIPYKESKIRYTEYKNKKLPRFKYEVAE